MVVMQQGHIDYIKPSFNEHYTHLILGLLFIIIIPNVSGVILTSGDILTANDTNATIYIADCSIYVDMAVINETTVSLYNVSYTINNKIITRELIVYATQNGVYDCSSFPKADITITNNCVSTLGGLQQFGIFLPILIIVMIAGLIIYFIYGDGNNINISDNAPLIVITIIIIAIGGIIINAISSGC